MFLEAGSVVPADAAPDDPANGEQVTRKKPIATTPKTIKNTQTNNTGNH
ncbi:MAG: hypothetical protein QW461_02260 [Candidatus Jordarchaeales archaeon]